MPTLESWPVTLEYVPIHKTHQKKHSIKVKLHFYQRISTKKKKTLIIEPIKPPKAAHQTSFSVAYLGLVLGHGQLWRIPMLIQHSTGGNFESHTSWANGGLKEGVLYFIKNPSGTFCMSSCGRCCELSFIRNFNLKEPEGSMSGTLPGTISAMHTTAYYKPYQ